MSPAAASGAPRLPLPGPASPLRPGSPRSPPLCSTFIAGTGQEGPERCAQEKARPEGGPAGRGVAAGQRSRGAGGDSAAARGPPAPRTPGPQAPHLLPAASAAAARARGSVQGSGPPSGRKGSRLLSPRLPARGLLQMRGPRVLGAGGSLLPTPLSLLSSGVQ